MSKPPINPAGLCVALSAMNLRHPRERDRTHWAIKAQILCQVASYNSGEMPVELAIARFEERTKRNRNTIVDGLDELVEDRVLFRENGSGPLAHMYRINPDIRQWRNVPWHRWAVSDLEREVGFATGEFKASAPEQSRVVFSARHQRFVARRIQRATTRALYTTRDKHGNQGLQSREKGPSTRDKTGERVTNSGSVENISLSKEQSERVFKIKGALKRRTGARGVWGEPETKIKRLVIAGATTEELLELIARMPPEMQPQSGADWLCEEWHSRDVTDAPPAGPDPDALRGRLATIDALIATCEDVGDEEEMLKLKAERVDVVRVLADLDNGNAKNHDDRQMEA